MNKVIAIEGIDGVGKTTILDRIHKLNNRHIAVSSSMPQYFVPLKEHFDNNPNTISKFLFFLNALVESHSTIQYNENIRYVFFDRFLPSLFVYHHVFNGLPMQKFKSYIAPFKEIIKQEDYLILLDCDDDLLHERILKKDNKNCVENDFILDKNKIKKIKESYFLYYENFHNTKSMKIFDTTTNTPEQTVIEIFNFLNI